MLTTPDSTRPSLPKTIREAVSVRARFEVFKRDKFTCRYCGRTSPTVVLELDHIVPVAEGGSSDPINLATSCWDCNRGKSDVPLREVLLGEDPHDRAVMMLERERQLREYNQVLAQVARRVEQELENLIDYWESHGGRMTGADETRLNRLLESHPAETLLSAMKVAVRNRKTAGLAYFNTVLANAHGAN